MQWEEKNLALSRTFFVNKSFKSKSILSITFTASCYKLLQHTVLEIKPPSKIVIYKAHHCCIVFEHEVFSLFAFVANLSRL